MKDTSRGINNVHLSVQEMVLILKVMAKAESIEKDIKKANNMRSAIKKIYSTVVNVNKG